LVLGLKLDAFLEEELLLSSGNSAKYQWLITNY
jgi:hypothetical protein